MYKTPQIFKTLIYYLTYSEVSRYCLHATISLILLNAEIICVSKRAASFLFTLKSKLIYLHWAAFSLWISALSAKVSIISSNANHLLNRWRLCNTYSSFAKYAKTAEARRTYYAISEQQTAYMQRDMGVEVWAKERWPMKHKLQL